MFCDGVRLWRRPHDAHTQRCVLRAQECVLCGLCHPWFAVPPRPQDRVQVNGGHAIYLWNES